MKFLRKTLPALCLAGLLAAAGAATAADDRSLDDSAKKVGNNFGELLKGMGQELKKAGGSLSGSAKKEDQKEKPRPENEPAKDEDNSR